MPGQALRGKQVFNFETHIMIKNIQINMFIQIIEKLDIKSHTQDFVLNFLYVLT